jgi:antitoxin HicB
MVKIRKQFYFSSPCGLCQQKSLNPQTKDGGTGRFFLMDSNQQFVLEPAEEGGWVVRSPIIPELITEIDHLGEIDEKIKDAVAAAKELYEDMGKELCLLFLINQFLYRCPKGW